MSIGVNMPGLCKSTDDAKIIFEAAMDAILKSNLKIISEQRNKTKSGYEALIVVDNDVKIIKNRAMLIEQKHLLGRFMDIDVIDVDYHIISRKELLDTPRKCYICDNDAKICARSQRHTLEELLSFIHTAVVKYEKN